jgi:hypothetical protein
MTQRTITKWINLRGPTPEQLPGLVDEAVYAATEQVGTLDRLVSVTHSSVQAMYWKREAGPMLVDNGMLVTCLFEVNS